METLGLLFRFERSEKLLSETKLAKNTGTIMDRKVTIFCGEMLYD